MTHRHEGPRPKFQFTEALVHSLIKIFRDLVIFAAGIFGFIHELLRSGDERAPQ
jgi:hypothetical protein